MGRRRPLGEIGGQSTAAEGNSGQAAPGEQAALTGSLAASTGLQRFLTQSCRYALRNA